MYTAIFTVTLRLPDTMTPEEARANLKTSVSFGSPVITHPFVIPDDEPEPPGIHARGVVDVQTPSDRL